MTTLFFVEFGLFLSGLACLFLGGLAGVLGLRRLRELPWPCLAVFGFGFGAAQWMALWSRLRDLPPAFDAVQLALAAAALASLCEFGRRGLHGGGRRISARLLYAPIVVLLAAATWAAVAAGQLDGLRAVCRYTLALPGGLLAGLALLGVSTRGTGCRGAGCQPAGKNPRQKPAPKEAGWQPAPPHNPLRWAAVAMLVWAAAFGLIVPAAGFFPASWLNEDALAAATRLPAELLAAGCLLVAMAGVWWHQRGPEWALRHPGLVRRWLLPVAFVIVAGCGWVTTARLARGVDAEQYAVAAVASGAGGEAVGQTTGVVEAAPAEGSKGWSKISSQRLHTGLPIVIIAFLVLGGMAAVAARLAERHP